MSTFVSADFPPNVGKGKRTRHKGARESWRDKPGGSGVNHRSWCIHRRLEYQLRLLRGFVVARTNLPLESKRKLARASLKATFVKDTSETMEPSKPGLSGGYGLAANLEAYKLDESEIDPAPQLGSVNFTGNFSTSLSGQVWGETTLRTWIPIEWGEMELDVDEDIGLRIQRFHERPFQEFSEWRHRQALVTRRTRAGPLPIRPPPDFKETSYTRMERWVNDWRNGKSPVENLLDALEKELVIHKCLASAYEGTRIGLSMAHEVMANRATDYVNEVMQALRRMDCDELVGPDFDDSSSEDEEDNTL